MSTHSTPLSNDYPEARRRLTYDVEDDSTAAACPYPREPQSSQRLDSFRGTQGLAIVQPQPTTNGLDYAAAVRRQNLNGRSKMPQRLRAALPPRGRTPCDPAYQSTMVSQARGPCPSGRQN